jgi:hypothetical protein
MRTGFLPSASTCVGVVPSKRQSVGVGPVRSPPTNHRSPRYSTKSRGLSGAPGIVAKVVPSKLCRPVSEPP